LIWACSEKLFDEKWFGRRVLEEVLAMESLDDASGEE